MRNIVGLVYELSPEQLNKLDEVYTTLNLIWFLSESGMDSTFKKLKVFLKAERSTSRGKLKKIYAAMYKSNNLVEGMHSQMEAKLESIERQKSQVS